MLGTLVFEDPRTGDLLPAVQYLSGDVRTKLEAAREAAKDESRFETNVRALEGAMPEQVTAMDIIAKPGVRYVEPADYEAFIAERFGVAATVATNEVDASWELRSANGSPRFSPEVRFSYATGDRTPLALLQSLMNNRTIVIRRTITDEHGSERQSQRRQSDAGSPGQGRQDRRRFRDLVVSGCRTRGADHSYLQQDVQLSGFPGLRSRGGSTELSWLERRIHAAPLSAGSCGEDPQRAGCVARSRGRRGKDRDDGDGRHGIEADRHRQ